MKNLFSAIIFILFAYPTLGQEKIPAKEATKYVDKTVTICDSVYSSKSLGGLIVFNVGSAFPNQPFTFVIFKNDLHKFKNPIDLYTNKKICITGKVVLYKDKPQIVVNEPKQMVAN